jgi:prevent-host-death family protein
VIERVVAAVEARRNLGKLLQCVLTRGDRVLVVVERYGKPVAALVPIAGYELWKRACEDFLGARGI